MWGVHADASVSILIDSPPVAQCHFADQIQWWTIERTMEIQCCENWKKEFFIHRLLFIVVINIYDTHVKFVIEALL